MLTGIATLVALLLLSAVPGLLFIFGLGGFLVVAFFPFLFEPFCLSNPTSWYSLPCEFKGYVLAIFLFAIVTIIGATKEA